MARGRTDAELRAFGVPESVLRLWRSETRVWSAPLRNVEIDGERFLTLDEREERRKQLRIVGVA